MQEIVLYGIQSSNSPYPDFLLQHALLPKAESKPLENSCPRPPNTYSVHDGEPTSTFESKHRVIGGMNPPNLDGLAPFAIVGFSMVEDYVTLLKPTATNVEQMEASLSLLNPVGKVKKTKNAMDALEKVDAVSSVIKDSKKTRDPLNLTQKEKQQFKEYIEKQDKGTAGIGTPPRYGERRIFQTLYNELRDKTPTDTIRKELIRI